MGADLENDLLVLLSDTSRHLRTYSDQMARGMGMTRAQLIILARLERQPDLSQNELAELTEVAPITVARLIDRLEALGYVKRCTDPADRRIWRLRLTRAAGPVLREIRQYRAKLHRILTGSIEPEVLTVMRTGLRQMKANVSRRRRLADAAA